MLLITTKMDKQHLCLFPVDAFVKLHISDLPIFKDILTEFDISVRGLSEFKPNEEIQSLSIKTRFGNTTMEHISDGVAVYCLAKVAKVRNLKIQFISGAFGLNIGQRLVDLALDTDNISIYLQGPTVAIPYNRLNAVKLEGFDIQTVTWGV